MNRRAFLCQVARGLCLVGMWVGMPLVAFAAPLEADRPDPVPPHGFQPPAYWYPPKPDPHHTPRKKAIARRKIHDAVSEMIDQLLEAEHKEMAPDEVQQLKDKFAKDYEQILGREFMLFDDP